jgi:hypothetical protein
VNPSYLLLRRQLDDAMTRYGTWIAAPEVAAPREVAERDAIDLALQDGEWRGLALYVFASGPWAVFEELSGGLAARPAEDWLRLADGGDLLYVGYNDAIGYGELVRVDAGRLVRQFLEDEQDPTADVNVGKLPEEAGQPIVHWTDVARWVEETEDAFMRSDRGWLLIHRAG